MGDQFALVDFDSGNIRAFPRAIGLKNQTIRLFADADPARLGPELKGTPQGTIRHLKPNAEALARMEEPARPALLLFPRFGRDLEAEVRPVGAAEVFVRLTQSSTNYVALGERVRRLRSHPAPARTRASTIRRARKGSPWSNACSRCWREARRLPRPPPARSCRGGGGARLDGAPRDGAGGIAARQPRLPPRG